MNALSDPASTIFSDHQAVVVALPSAPPSPLPCPPAEPALSDVEIGTAHRYAVASRAPSTQRAYVSDWRRFSAWCAARNLDTLPADPRVVAVFLAAEAHGAPRGGRRGTPNIEQRLAAVDWMHRRAGYQPPHPGEHVRLRCRRAVRRSVGHPRQTPAVRARPGAWPEPTAGRNWWRCESPTSSGGRRDRV